MFQFKVSGVLACSENFVITLKEEFPLKDWQVYLTKEFVFVIYDFDHSLLHFPPNFQHLLLILEKKKTIIMLSGCI